MEAYVLFARGKQAIRFEEQEEDIGCDSSAAGSSTSSSDEVELADDASSSGSTGDHFEMASLMTQLPIKRGLSKFFDGKSQSFASLAAVAGLEDLPKPPAKRLKASRSCGVGLKDAHRGSLAAPAAGKKQAPRARLSAPRRLMRMRPLVTARPAAAAGQPLLFA
ncbi:hypothetical protein SEVIR_7G224000v4 [Setaria viridis]|uniref:Uncharacterized protein n=2 Tax=Setaria TaxID=4554 RepID=K3YAF9_SETIT|nr:uncharacterized protein LOC101767531 [Setaria italica]XP_034602032.1 uncharacterized protein LOC117862641 [Setaria viridis]RCV35097.1 hypothetical protein SETIT_7G212300v2 [Setaria italica]TKW06160.1 hypothetical protein SEVIR_7G224000v2 [Setaria viridis]